MPSTARHIASRRLAALTAAVLTATLIAVTTPAAQAATQKRWHGYGIAKTGKAAGGWIGGYKSGRQVIYRIDPDRRAPSGTLGPVRPRAKVASKRATARAAWIVSKYGTYPSRTQSAAVDAALLHVLHRGAWKLGGTKGKRRLAQSGHSGEVRSLAATMLAQSEKLAGPYRVRVSANRAAKGGDSVVVAKVQTLRGRPVSKLPVTIRFGSMGQRSGSTGSRGTVRLHWKAGTPRRYPVRVVVSRVPSSVLLVRTPKRGSRVVVAGRKTTRTRNITGVVKATPRVSVNAPRRVLNIARIRPTLSIAGSNYERRRHATVRLYGPSQSSAPACSGHVARAYRVSTRGNGRFKLPQLALRTVGTYSWKVSLPGDGFNTAASRCVGKIDVFRHSRVSVVSPQKKFRIGGAPAARIRVSRAADGYAGRARASLYGPFSTAKGVSCGSRRRMRTVSVALHGNRHPLSPAVKVTAPGWYVWSVKTTTSNYTYGSRSGCAKKGGVLHVINR